MGTRLLPFGAWGKKPGWGEASNVLHYGDNLKVLRDSVKDESVDLIYLDPPFNSQRAYNVIFREEDSAEPEAQVKAFDDYWRWDAAAEATYQQLVNPRPHTHASPERLIVLIQALRKSLGDGNMLAYLIMMGARLVELYRVLKPTGSLYLHCDPTASHYLKMLLDAVFGFDRFRSEIIWTRTSAHSGAKRFGPVHDVILFYSKGEEYTWNEQFQPYDEEYVDTFFEQNDPDGKRWKRGDLTGPGIRTGDSGKPWRGIDVTAKGRHWQPASYVYEKYRKLTGEDLAQFPFLERLDQLDKIGLIHWPEKKKGMPRYKCYLEDMPGTPLQDIWMDIRPLHNLSSERTHYPTQKPLALLNRIIEASSNAGDVVLDPFCGCGTAIEAAETLKRSWIGIDITYLAIPIIRRRLAPIIPPAQFRITGDPVDLKSALALADSDPYQFQWWSLDRIGAFPVNSLVPMGREGRKGGDKGIDGILRFKERPEETESKRIIVSVKAGRSLNPGMVRDLRGTIEREGAPIGVLLTMHEPSAQMRTEAANAGKYRVDWTKREYDRIQILTAENIFQKKGVEFPGYDVTEEEFKSGQLSLFNPMGNASTPAKPHRDLRPMAAAPTESEGKKSKRHAS